MRTNTTVNHRYVRAALSLAFGAASIITFACSGSSLASPERTSRLLVGEWELVSGCGGIAYHCVDASELNEPSRYRFESNGFVTAFRGSAQLFRLTYTVTPGSSDGEGDERPILIIGGGPLVDPRPLRVSFEGADTLLLDEGCCDRFTFRFRRLQMSS